MLTHPYFTLLVNDDTEKCATDLQQIVEEGHLSESDTLRARAVVEELLRDVRAELAKLAKA